MILEFFFLIKPSCGRYSLPSCTVPGIASHPRNSQSGGKWTITIPSDLPCTRDGCGCHTSREEDTTDMPEEWGKTSERRHAVLVFSFFITNSHRLSGLKQHLFISSQFHRSEFVPHYGWLLCSVSQGWNRGICFQPHSSCWHSSVPCGCKVGGPISFQSASQGLLSPSRAHQLPLLCEPPSSLKPASENFCTSDPPSLLNLWLPLLL